jgi:hypothetical protein
MATAPRNPEEMARELQEWANGRYGIAFPEDDEASE